MTVLVDAGSAEHKPSAPPRPSLAGRPILLDEHRPVRHHMRDAPPAHGSPYLRRVPWLPVRIRPSPRQCRSPYDELKLQNSFSLPHSISNRGNVSAQDTVNVISLALFNRAGLSGSFILTSVILSLGTAPASRTNSAALSIVFHFFSLTNAIMLNF